MKDLSKLIRELLKGNELRVKKKKKRMKERKLKKLKKNLGFRSITGICRCTGNKEEFDLTFP